jgi:hypothetical protein
LEEESDDYKAKDNVAFIDNKSQDEDSGKEEDGDEDERMFDDQQHETYDMAYEDLVDDERKDKGRDQRYQMMRFGRRRRGIFASTPCLPLSLPVVLFITFPLPLSLPVILLYNFLQIYFTFNCPTHVFPLPLSLPVIIFYNFLQIYFTFNCPTCVICVPSPLLQFQVVPFITILSHLQRYNLTFTHSTYILHYKHL